VRRGDAGSDADRSFAASIQAEDVADRMSTTGARLVAIGDPEYPSQLLDLFDPPAGLFVAGGSLDGLRSSVAIVGARNASPSGAEMAAVLARSVAGCSAAVVSGGARGIDGAAHRGAIEGGGTTIAVLGSGIDVPYPRQNRRLFERIREQGALVSEYPPGTHAEPFRFPARNRIVAALAQALVVVEGAEGSGSMITADQALDLGREVFAVPGAVTSALSQVPLALIRDGATLIRGPDDLLNDLGLEWALPPSTEGPGSAGSRDDGADSSAVTWARGPAAAGISPREAALWSALQVPSVPDRLATETGMVLGDVVSALVGLELRGLVRQVGGRYERRVDGRRGRGG
jgi:DNA processing protein